MAGSGINWDDVPELKPGSGINWDAVPSIDDARPKTKEESTLEWLKRRALANPVTSALDAGYNIASSAVALPVSGLVGLAGAALPGPEGQGARWQEATADALTHHTATPGGSAITKVLGYPTEKLAEGSNIVGEKIADAGYPAIGAGVNAGMNMLPQVLSYGAGKIAPGGVNARLQAGRDVRELATRPNDTAAERVRAEGYRINPTAVDPTIKNKVAEGLVGGNQLAHDFGIHNQPIAQQAFREELGIRPGIKLEPLELAQERSTRADPAYDAVRAQPAGGTVSLEYLQEVGRMRRDMERQAKAFPNAKLPTELDDVGALRTGTVDPDAWIAKIRELRNKSTMLRQGEQPDVIAANFQADLANIVERELERHLKTIGAPKEVIENFREARRYTAVSHALQDNINAAGEVDSVGFSKQLAIPNPPPLSPRMRAVAELGGHFPGNAVLPSVARPGLHISDYAVTGLAGTLGAWLGGPKGAVTAATLAGAGRPVGRALLNTEFAQNRMATKKDSRPSSVERFLGRISQPTVPLTATALGQEELSEEELRRQALIDALR